MMAKRGKAPSDFTARDIEMCVRFKKGQTLAKIGNAFGVSRERVRQRLKLYGLTGMDGGQQVHIRKIREAADEKRAKNKKDRVTKNYGIDVETYDRLVSEIGMASLHRYRTMKHHVKNNKGWDNVPWRLSLSQYAAVWKAAGLPVNAKGYGLARINRKHGFTYKNLEIVTRAEISRRSGIGNGKLTIRQARKIFNDTRSNQVIADEYGVTRNTIWAIRHKRTYRYLHE